MINYELLESLNILYLDDSELTKNSIKPFFAKFFKNVFLVSNEEEALSQFKICSNNGIKIDILITDIHKSKMDAFGLISKIKDYDSTIKVVITSNSINPDIFLESIKLKIDHFALKPINSAVLINEIKEIFFKSKDNLFSQINHLSPLNKIALVSKINQLGKIIYMNDFFTEIFQYTENELLNQDYDYIYDSSVSNEIKENIWDCISSGNVWNGILKCRSNNGDSYFISTYIFPMFDKLKTNSIIEYTIIGFQATERVIEKREFQKNILLKKKKMK